MALAVALAQPPSPRSPFDPRSPNVSSYVLWSETARLSSACPHRSLSVSSVSSVSSATSSSSSVHSVDSEDMYADLASPVSSASSRSPTPAQTKKERGMAGAGLGGVVQRGSLCSAPSATGALTAVPLAGKSKKEDGVKEEKRKRDVSAQPPKSKPSASGKSSQQPAAPAPAPPGQPPQASFVAHKEIKLTLLNKVSWPGGPSPSHPAAQS